MSESDSEWLRCMSQEVPLWRKRMLAIADKIEALEHDMALYRRRWEACEDRRRSTRPVTLRIGANSNALEGDHE